MVDPTDLATLDHATKQFSQVLAPLRSEDLDGPTACGDWTIRDIANHVCGGALRYAHYMRGGTADGVAWTRAADHVGDNPRAVHDQSSAELRKLFARPGAGSIRAQHPMQTVSGDELLCMRVEELAVHAWDIASTLDPAATINPTLAAYVLDRGAEILQMQRSHGYFAEVALANEEAPAEAHLLAFTGRSMPQPPDGPR